MPKPKVLPASLLPPDPEVVLRPMGEHDVDPVLEIERAAFRSPWKARHFLHEMRQNRWAVNLVAERDGIVVGYACLWCLHEELQINNIAIRETERRRGLGRWLLRRALWEGISRGCRLATLEVRPSNAAALTLYRREGFVEVGRRPGYYAEEGEDALLLEADLGRLDWVAIAPA